MSTTPNPEYYSRLDRAQDAARYRPSYRPVRSARDEWEAELMRQDDYGTRLLREDRFHMVLEHLDRALAHARAILVLGDGTGHGNKEQNDLLAGFFFNNEPVLTALRALETRHD